METTNGTATSHGVSDALHRLGEIPGKLEREVKTRPFTVVAAVAGLSFICGMIFGSRTGRALMVAAAPVIATRLLDGPLGEDLGRYIRSAFPSANPSSKSA